MGLCSDSCYRVIARSPHVMTSVLPNNRLQLTAHSRVLHPIWEGSTGWILTHRGSHKSKHLAANPHTSLAYVRSETSRST
jgi:hypothetical protein